MMTSKERILRTLDRQETDRVPIAMRGMEPMNHLWTSWFERAVMLRDRFGIDDFLYKDFIWQYAKEVREERRWETWGKDENPLLVTTYHTPAGPLTTRVVMTEDFHVERLTLSADQLMPRSVERLLKDRSDLEKLKYLLADPAACDVRQFDERMQSYVDFGNEEGFPIAVTVPSFSGIAMKNIGINEILMSAMDDDPWVDEVFDLYLEWALKWMEYGARFGPDIAYHSGYLESTDFWSPGLFRRYFAPRQKRLADRAHALGMKYINYITTGIDALTEEFRGLGIDALYGWDSIPPGDADMARLKSVLGNEMAFWGGISPSVTVERGTPEEVRRAVKQAIEILAPGGGYILCTGGSVFFEEQAGLGGARWQGAPEESVAHKNLLTLFEAGLEFGVHPIGADTTAPKKSALA